MRLTKKKQTLTGIEALDNIRDCGEWLPSLEMGIIRRELKALDIIKEKRVDVQLLKDSKNINDYNWCVHTKDRALTQEEYDSLKEVLL